MAGLFLCAIGTGAAALAQCAPAWVLRHPFPMRCTLGSGVFALRSFDGGGGEELFVGGYFGGETIPAPDLWRWNGRRWDDMEVNGRVYALCPYDDGTGLQLYVLGRFSGAGSVVTENGARWDGVNWRPFPLAGEPPFELTAAAVFDDGRGDALYVAGQFSRINGEPLNNIARWDGVQWEALGAGWVVRNTSRVALKVHDDGTGEALYLGGYFDIAGGRQINNIARWDGRDWSPLDTGLPGAVFALEVFDAGAGPRLFAGGAFAGEGLDRLAVWDGVSWASVGSPNRSVQDLLRCDLGEGPELCVSGNFTAIDGHPFDHIARWNGKRWAGLGDVPADLEDWAYIEMASFDDGVGEALFVGGYTPFGRNVDLLTRYGCIRGDLNCDGALDASDIEPFILALTDPAGYAFAYPDCKIELADMNADGQVNAFDIEAFVSTLSQ